MKNINKKYEKAIKIDDEEESDQKEDNLEQFDIIIPKEVSEKVNI